MPSDGAHPLEFAELLILTLCCVSCFIKYIMRLHHFFLLECIYLDTPTKAFSTCPLHQNNVMLLYY